MNWKFWKSVVPKRDTNTVYWGYEYDRNSAMIGMALTSFPPEPVLKYYYTGNQSFHMKCPAFLSSHQNLYVIRCPIDIEIEYDRSDPNSRKMNVIKPAQNANVRNYILEPRFREVNGTNAHELFSLKIAPYLFWSEQSVMLEVMTPFLEWENPNRVRVIGGEFNIGKWTRGLEYAIEAQYPVGKLSLKRGDPLMYVRLTAENPHTKLHLKEAPITEEIRERAKQNALLKTVMTGCPMNKLYELRRQYDERQKA